MTPNNTPYPAEPSPVGSERARCLKPAEAADFLGISRTKIYDLLASGELNSVKIGRSRRIPLAALDSFVRGLMETRD